MKDRYGHCPSEEASVIVALGGDGFMLRTLHRFIDADLPVYGMKLGNVGFLMNRHGFGPAPLDFSLSSRPDNVYRIRGMRLL